MAIQKNIFVKPIKNNKLEYKSQPICVRITPEQDAMITYISKQTTLNTSSIVRYGISELYKKVKKE